MYDNKTKVRYVADGHEVARLAAQRELVHLLALLVLRAVRGALLLLLCCATSCNTLAYARDTRHATGTMHR